MTLQNESSDRRFSSRDALMLAGGVLLTLLSGLLWTMWGPSAETDTAAEKETPTAASSPNEVTVSREVLTAAGVDTAAVAARARTERLQATGVVEPNQLQIQKVTPLVAGRIEQVQVALGDSVRAGMPLFTLASPQIAELLGNLRSAEAKLAESEATLNRTRKLVDLGAGAGKDLVGAEAEHRAAQAQAAQLRQSLQAFGASTTIDADTAATSAISIGAPVAGTVIERAVNPGEWIEAGRSVVTLANLATVWVIANVPEARLNVVTRGAPVEIRVPSQGDVALSGRVSYIDAQLDQDTRTARVRVEVPNPGQQLKIGMFVDVVVEGSAAPGAPELTIPSEAVQRIGERSVVFIPTADAGHFEVRDVELGDEIQGARLVRKGLREGERVVTRGGFTLKSQLLKGQFGEEEEISGK
jgi:membrane fusion protein, heavy metal efflux system